MFHLLINITYRSPELPPCRARPHTTLRTTFKLDNQPSATPATTWSCLSRCVAHSSYLVRHLPSSSTTLTTAVETQGEDNSKSKNTKLQFTEMWDPLLVKPVSQLEAQTTLHCEAQTHFKKACSHVPLTSA